MSRLGKKPVEIPAGVKVSVAAAQVLVEASGKKLTCVKHPCIKVEVDETGKQVVVTRTDDLRQSKALHGLTRALIQNMVIGVSKGFTKELEIVGVGWNAQVKGKIVALKVGYADVKEVPIPDGVTVQVAGPKVTISGIDRQKVGDCAARIRKVRKPEPYNGKGIKYIDEVIIRKQGKAFAGK